MPDWDQVPGYEGSEPSEETRTTLRQLIVRVVALLLLFSVLGTFYLYLRGIEHIVLVIGILLGVAYVGSVLRKQREQENPYDYDGTADFENR